ncbi:hypothetical protein AVEN_26757-1 [Araneus ventricosus]|uniref:BAG domain-containing protein n=1 Tax=Araneus ventricosus TaxID=182803 RepID=A0A4Y2D767_ARAVE|nr:hypothetical protein AVEN_26757-1 [Araneus ventricosus]
MDFRRIPFQFSTTDPLKRQEELQRRFGLPTNKGMYVDFANPGAMGSRSDNSSASNSPRLQHRVPIFVEGQSEPTKPSVDAQNVDSGRKPHVRVIPIEIEGEDNTSKRHRWPSGLSEPIKERVNSTSIPVETIGHPVQDPSPQSPKAPRVCNIPIKIEGSDHVIRPKSPVKTQKVKTPESPKHTGIKLNGCSASKVAKVNEKRESPKASEKKESPEEVTLKKIQNIEEKLKGYHADVEKFSGTNKEKQYRYLDEMLTRCMLELDEIDTMGLDAIRLARKAAVKKVQASIDLLESKISKEENKQDQVSKEPMEVESSAVQPSENARDDDTKIEEAETEETKKSEAVPAETSMDNQLSMGAGSASVEVTGMLHEQISEKVENISIMETEEGVLKPDEKEPVLDNSANETSVTNEKMNIDVIEPVQITEVEAGVDIVTSEIEPVVEEPLSDSKDENAVDMELDNCESDIKLDEPSSVQICEVENDAVSNPNKLEARTSGQSDPNLEMEVTETAGADESLTAEQSATSVDSNNDSANISNSNIPANS